MNLHFFSGSGGLADALDSLSELSLSLDVDVSFSSSVFGHFIVKKGVGRSKVLILGEIYGDLKITFG